MRPIEIGQRLCRLACLYICLAEKKQGRKKTGIESQSVFHACRGRIELVGKILYDSAISPKLSRSRSKSSRAAIESRRVWIVPRRLRGARTFQQFIQILRLPIKWAGCKSCEKQHEKHSAPSK